MKNPFYYKWYLSFIFSWLTVTSVYVIYAYILGQESSPFVGYLGAIVPIGIFTLIFGTFAAPIATVFILVADLWAWTLGIRMWYSKIVFNLYGLLFCTFFVETLFLTGWPSLETGTKGFGGGVTQGTYHPYPTIEALIWTVFAILVIATIVRIIKRRIVSKSLI